MGTVVPSSVSSRREAKVFIVVGGIDVLDLQAFSCARPSPPAKQVAGKYLPDDEGSRPLDCHGALAGEGVICAEIVHGEVRELYLSISDDVPAF